MLRPKLPPQKLASIFWIMIGIYVAIHAYLLGLGSFHHPGPGFILFLVALFLTILGAIDLPETYIRRLETEKRRGPYTEGKYQ